jgi:hypothetical protein
VPGEVKSVKDAFLAAGRTIFVMELVKRVPIIELCDVRKLTPRQRLAVRQKE